MISLQEHYAPKSLCYGCGPANPQGLHIKSVVKRNEVFAQWQPLPHHNAFPGILSGGIIGTLLDCHSNWSASWYLMQQDNLTMTPPTVTAEYHVKLKRPTPMNALILRANLLAIEGKKARIFAELISENKVCATCEGVFVAVEKGHPAYERWNG